MLSDFENTEEDFKLEESRYFAAQVAGFYRKLKGRERLETSATTAVQAFIEDAIPLVAEGVEAAFEAEIAKGSGGQREWYPAIRDMDPLFIAMLAVRSCVDATSKRWGLSHLNVQIGRTIEANLFAQAAQEVYASSHPRGKKVFNQIHKSAKEKSSDFQRRVSYVKHQVAKSALMVGYEDWPEPKAAKVGMALLDIVLKSTDIFEIYQIRRKPTDIRSSQDLLGFQRHIQDQIDENNLRLDWHGPAYRPMVVFPNDWDPKSEHFGPYMDFENAVRTPLVKNAGASQKKRLAQALRHGTMQEPLDAINTLQRVPYKINKFTFDALVWVKESLLDEPLQDKKFPPLSPVDIPDETEDNKVGREAQKRWRQIMRQRLVEASHMQVEADLFEAKSLMDRPDRPFWLPHHFDTRGRVYHCTGFGHHRNDYVRGLFLFADLKPVTSDNIHHLYYQVANTWAEAVSDTDSRKTDKISLQERYQWTHDNLEKLMAVGKDFVTGFDHWSQAGEPFQHLAACRELYLAQTHGEGYMTGLPIGFDGACSGLQHYAMASKWKTDAYKVNLVPNLPQPEDCYQYIADYSKQMAERLVAGDQEALDIFNFNQDQILDCQRWLDHGITRKTSKVNTMTWSYSVTLVGMADQIRDNIMDAITNHCDDTKQPHPFGDDCGFRACNTMAQLNWHSVSSVIESGAAGMQFLRSLAGTVARNGKHLEWTSLIGFPVSQEYFKELKPRYEGFCFDHNKPKQPKKYLTLTINSDDLDVGDAVTGAAPNFVHHLDSTHLMMTVNKAKDYGVTNLMVVHDSFSTDIESADTMLECIKTAAVEMYEHRCPFSDILEDAKALFDDPDGLIEWPEIPPKGEGDNALDIWGILECDYAFA